MFFDNLSKENLFLEVNREINYRFTRDIQFVPLNKKK